MMINDKFVETAFTANEVDQTIAEEKRRGIQDVPCTFLKDEQLDAAKREYQARSRALVRSGERTQESMFFIPVEVVRTLKIIHRSTEF
jgi:hypothetical protein